MLLLFAVLLIVVAAVLTALGWDVRLVLVSAAVLLGLAGGYLPEVSRKFFDTFSGEAYIVPICTAMGFAYVLKLTGCDQHLVRVLVAPVRRVRFLIVPGVVLAGFVTNVPVLSQTSVAVCLGAVVVPVMRAAGFHPLVIGSALLLGSSVGGELFNPGAPELNTVKDRTGTDVLTLARAHLPRVVLPQLVVSTLVFWALTRWWWKSDAPAEETPASLGRINWLKAAVPVVPLVLLLLSGEPLKLIAVPPHWLVEVKAPPAVTADERTAAVVGPAAEVAREEGVRAARAKAVAAAAKAAGGRTVGLAMVIGAAVAALTSPRRVSESAKAFFEGAGYGFAHIVSLIVAAVTFGKAVELAGFGEVVRQLVTAAPWLLVPLAVLLPGAFAAASGSGMASTASLYGFFHQPDAPPGVNEDVGALVSIGSAAGRTMSPVAAVAVMCGRLTDTTPWALAGRVAIPLLAGLVVVIALRMCGVV